MAQSYIIGIDIGTQGTKAALFTESGESVAEAFQSSKLEQSAGGVVTEDPEEQLGAACRAIAECAEKLPADGEVAAIGIDGQMAGILAVGDDGMHVTPYDSWLDTRCAPYIDYMRREVGNTVLEKAGAAPSFNHGPKVLWWKHEHPDIFKQIRAFVQPGSYVAMRLCGLGGDQAYIDRTYLHFSGFADNRHSRWDPELCSHFGVPMEKLPHIRNPEERIGSLTPEMGERCGLSSGVPVVAGCGDTAASFLSSGATEGGVCVDVAGTASVFAATTTEFRPDTASGVLGVGQSAIEGLWHPFAYINGGGMNLEWFRKEFTGAGIRGDADQIDFDQLNALAERATPQGVFPLFVPHLAGRVMPPQPKLRGAFVGLEWEHGAGELYRAMLEGVALEYGIYQKALTTLDPNFTIDELRITGGGEKSELWNRIKATVLGTQIRQVIGSKGAPMGAAMVAAYGVGIVSSLPEVPKRWLTFGDSFGSIPELEEIYRKKLGAYQRLIDALNSYSEEEANE